MEQSDKEIGVEIYVINMPLLDKCNGKYPIGTFIADLVLQILFFCSENERVNIKRLLAEGIAAARARAVYLGRPAIPIPYSFEATFEGMGERKDSLS